MDRRRVKGRISGMLGKKHSDETKELLRLLNTGSNNRFFGKKHSEETKKKLSEIRKKNPNRYWLGKKRGETPEEVKKKISEVHRKRGNNYYKQRNDLAGEIRKSFKYRKWRSDIYSRDNWTCQTCGKRGGSLEVHHIVKFRSLLDRFKIMSVEDAVECDGLWEVSNGVTLCLDCHNLTKMKKCPQ